MKIGILTFHCAHNYGAVLQAYALQEKIKETGHEVEIIDYKPDYLTTIYKNFDLKNIFSGFITSVIRKFVSYTLTYFHKVKRNRKFDEFIYSNFNMHKVSDGKIPDFYDLYVLGSDQIWNKRITKGFDKIYFGNFNTKSGSKIITYAASIGNAKIELEDIDLLNSLIKNIDGISVRESNLVPILKQITNKEIHKVVDPTFLLNPQQWSIMSKKPKIKKKYVLIYRIQSDNQILRIAKEIASQLKCTLIEIPAGVTLKYVTNKYIATSPDEFLGWIKHAECIISASFHGTAFSIIFNKPFYAINLNDGSEKRSKDLLESLGLEDRLIHKDSSVTFSNINFEESKKKLEEMKTKSIEFLNAYTKQIR